MKFSRSTVYILSQSSDHPVYYYTCTCIGIEVCTPEGNKTCRGIMLTCTVDLPARAAVCNMKGFNGAHSCTTCLDSGDNTVGSTHMHRYWPFNPNCEVRSLDSVHTTIVNASETGNPVSYLTLKQILVRSL